MNKLQQLIEKTKGSISLEINLHRDDYQTAEEYLKSYPNEKYLNDISQEVYDGMVEANTVIELTVYPDTPIGFYKLYHYDLDEVLTLALEDETMPPFTSNTIEDLKEQIDEFLDN